MIGVENEFQNTPRNRLPANFLRKIADQLQHVETREHLVFYSSELEASDVALHLFPKDKALQFLFEQTGLDPERPAHWRALLTALAEDFVESRGRKTIHRKSRRLELALDLYEAWQDIGASSTAKLIEALSESEPYKSEWTDVRRDATRQHVRRLIEELGGMDSSFKDRALQKFGHRSSDDRFNWPDDDSPDIISTWTK